MHHGVNRLAKCLSQYKGLDLAHTYKVSSGERCEGFTFGSELEDSVVGAFVCSP